MVHKNLVSIIVTCHGKSEFIEQAIKSVFAQTYTNIEIILANDGDTSKKLLIKLKLIKKKYCSIPIKIIFTRKNYGVSHCRNTCIQAANGIYIFPLDGDDLIHKNYILDCVKILDTNQNATIAYSLVLMFDAQKTWPKNRILAKHNESLVAAGYIPSAHLFKKYDWERVGGYSESLLYGEEDWDFNIKRILPEKEFVRINKYYMYYRQINDSRQNLFEKNSCLKFKNEIKIIQDNIDIFCKNIDNYNYHQKVKTKIIRKISSMFYLYIKYFSSYYIIKKTLRLLYEK